MNITADQTMTTLDDRPEMPAGSIGLDRTRRSQPKRTARAVLAGAVVSAVLGGGLAVALLDDDSASTPGPRRVPPTSAPARPLTRLDVRGVPEWWTAV